MARVIERGPARLEPNLTPMVDVVFQLIIFFAVFAHLSASERFDLPLPQRPETAATAAKPDERRIVVNVAPRDRAGELGGDYLVGGRAFDGGGDGLEALAALLRASVQADPDAEVIVRAARDERYDRVHPVLKAAAASGARRASLALEPREDAP